MRAGTRLTLLRAEFTRPPVNQAEDRVLVKREGAHVIHLSEDMQIDRGRMQSFPQSSNEELPGLPQGTQNRNMELGQLASDLSNLLTGIPSPVVMLGSDRRIRWFTPAAANLLSLVPSDIGRMLSEINSPLDFPDLDRMIAEALDHNSRVEQDVKDRKGHWYSLRIRSCKTAENRTDGVLIALLDIGMLIPGLDRIQQSEREAIVGRDLSTALLDMTGALVIIRDADGKVIGFNRAAEEVSGYSFEEVRGKTLWNFLFSPDQRVRAKAIFDGVIAGPNFAKDYESLWIRKDGSPCALVFSSVADRNPDGSVKRVVSTGLDITARKSAEEALRASEERYRTLADILRRSNTELKRANEDLNQFAYSASHDLQEPLRMVAIYSQMLQRKYGGKLDGDADQYLRYASQGARRMETLVKSLLEYAQAMNVAVDEAHPVDAGMVLEKALSNLAAAIEESGAVVTHGQLPTIAMQEIHLLQLFQNIVGNAIKYRSQAPPRIHVAAEPAGEEREEWTVRIQDNGIGIHAKYADRIFGVFKRLHSETEYTGTGIGLATCKRIVERYAGRIWVESEEGKGATFYFTVPAGKRKHATGIS